MTGLSVQADDLQEIYGGRDRVDLDASGDEDNDDAMDHGHAGEDDDDKSAAAGDDGEEDDEEDTTPVTRFVKVVAVFSAIGGMLFGYDIGVIGGVTTMDNFRDTMKMQRFVTGVEENSATTSKEGVVVAMFAVGCAFGSFCSGMAADKLGRRMASILGAALYTVGALLEAASNGFGMMVFGRIVAGLGVGCLSCVVPMYTAEVSPSRVRGMLSSLYQLMLTLGILVAFVTNAGTKNKEKGWRTSLGISCMLSSTLTIGMSFLPESPSWLLKNKGEALARKALSRLYQGYPDIVDRDIAVLKRQAAKDAKLPEGSWGDVFAGDMWKRLLIGWGAQFHQQLTGINVIMMYSVIIFGQAHIPEFTGTIIIGLVNVASTFLAMKFIDKLGRKWLLLVGALVQAICFIIAGVIINSTHLISSDALWPSTAVAECYSNITYYGEVAFDDSITPTGTLASVSQGECCAGNNGGQFTYYSSTQECRYFESGIADGGGGLNYMNNTVPSVGSAWSGGFVPQAPAKKGASYAVIFFICLFVVGFASSWGPTPWVIGAEIYPLRVRAKALSITTAAGNWLGTWLIGYATPAILKGLGVSGTFFLFAYFLVQAFFFTLFLIPETKGVSLSQIDDMFKNAKSWADIAKPTESLAAIFSSFGGGGSKGSRKYQQLGTSA